MKSICNIVGVASPHIARASTKANAELTSKEITYNPENLYLENPLLLPRLPIPNVTHTLQRYADTLSPLKSDVEVRAHMEKLRCFQDGSAQKLNRMLRQQDNKFAQSGKYPFNYVERMWDDGYLAFRGPSPINISPAVTLRSIPRIESSQCGVAAEYVHACLRWYAKFVAGELDIVPSKEGGVVLDLSQMSSQFGCCRVPEAGMDQRKATLRPRHIVVLHRGHVFEVSIGEENGSFYSPRALERSFTQILAKTTEENSCPVGVLSTGGRTDYAGYIKEVCNASPKNGELLERVQTAFMTVCLDVCTAADHEAKLQAVLHGIGSDRNNRWFDKHQLIVSKDGCVGFNLEYAFSDGITWARWMGEVWHHLNGTTHLTPYTPLPALDISKVDHAPYHSLNFQVPTAMQGVFNSAKQSWKSAAKNLYQGIVVADFGRSRLKKYKLSPDAFIQMAFHLAFYRLSGRMAPTQEYVSTASFFHGRTETLRSATNEMAQFVRCKGLEEPTETSSQLLEVANKCAYEAAGRHSSLVKLASQGQGVDRHLQVLKALAASEGQVFADANDFFNDPLYGYSGSWQMSTANAGLSPFAESYCFGPVLENGYGLGYVIHEDRVACSVSSFLSGRKSSGTRMRDALQQAMRDISVVLGSQKLV